jgi:hypothetical protein
MKCPGTIHCGALAVVFVACACARPETAAPQAEAAQARAGQAARRVEPAADARLRAMSKTLAGVQSFSFNTTDHRERINAKGEKVARESTAEYVVARPDRFWGKRTRDGVAAFAIYDGSTLTLQGDGEKVWSQVDMPPTIDETLDYAAEVYRFPMPIADLLYSDPYGSIVGDDTAVRMVGKEAVGALQCDHLAIETPAVNAGVWLESGERALPCKLDLVQKGGDDPPHTTIVFSNWNLAPQVDAARFAFTPPAGYNRIRMVAVMSPEEEARARAAAASRKEAAAQAQPKSGS